MPLPLRWIGIPAGAEIGVVDAGVVYAGVVYAGVKGLPNILEDAPAKPGL